MEAWLDHGFTIIRARIILAHVCEGHGAVWYGYTYYDIHLKSGITKYNFASKFIVYKSIIQLKHNSGNHGLVRSRLVDPVNAVCREPSAVGIAAVATDQIHIENVYTPTGSSPHFSFHRLLSTAECWSCDAERY